MTIVDISTIASWINDTDIDIYSLDLGWLNSNQELQTCMIDGLMSFKILKEMMWDILPAEKLAATLAELHVQTSGMTEKTTFLPLIQSQSARIDFSSQKIGSILYKAHYEWAVRYFDNNDEFREQIIDAVNYMKDMEAENVDA